MKANFFVAAAIVLLVSGVAACITGRRAPLWLQSSYLFVGILGVPYGWLGFALEH
jgi:uncharacterized MAPEG superfamily protein